MHLSDTQTFYGSMGLIALAAAALGPLTTRWIIPKFIEPRRAKAIARLVLIERERQQQLDRDGRMETVKIQRY